MNCNMPSIKLSLFLSESMLGEPRANRSPKRGASEREEECFVVVVVHLAAVVVATAI